MAKDKPAKYWRFKLDTRRKFTELSQEIARINSGGGGGGISELTSKMVVDALGYTPYNAANPANYITASALTPYALKTDIPSLVGYATEDFVNNKLGDYATKDYVTTKLVDYAPLTSVQGFENRIGGLEGAVPRLNERVETVESKVATLNEYVVTGDNNLLNRVNVIEQEYATKTYVDDAIGSVEQLVSTKLDSSYFTLTNIKSTLGISDWALASVKPSYTASEVGALRLNESSANADLDTILDSKTAELKPFFQALTTNDVGSARKGVLRMSYNGSESQLLFDHYNRLLRYRTIGENPKNWATIAFTSDIPTKLSQFTDDVVDGKYLPLSGGTVIGSITASTFIGNLMGNAGSATKLKTPHTLWGRSFDGTDDISGAITLGGDLNNAAGGIYIHYTNEINSFQGKLYLNHRGRGLTGYGSTQDVVMVGNGGNVGIGTISPTERLDVTGNIKADGNINATSITINGVTITASNGSITVNGNVFATGDITGGV